MPTNIDYQKIRRSIEHTMLKPDAVESDIAKICEEALRENFFGVCMNGSFVKFARTILKSSPVKLVAVVGFPLGACVSAVKAFETEKAIQDGADEIDMVISLGFLKARSLDAVKTDIELVVRAAAGRPVKVILETALLNLEDKLLACEISKQAGAKFVKTCTGFMGGGATVEDIVLMRKAVGQEFGVKASGGIKTSAQAWALIQAGANRLGTSSGVALVSAHDHLTKNPGSSY